MKTDIASVFNEYQTAKNFKDAIGDKGMAEQTKINARFFAGDQWSGAVCGNDRPLVRHNVIKRIGDYKMSHILSSPIDVVYSADNVANMKISANDMKNTVKKIAENPDFKFEGELSDKEINIAVSALSNYRRSKASKLHFDAICQRALLDAYICGGSVVYTYWDSRKDGDIASEVLSLCDVYFGDPYTQNLQDQPYIIIASNTDLSATLREADCFGADTLTKKAIEKSAQDGKVLVLTKLYREYTPDGKSSIKCLKVTENATVRAPFDTGLSLYPLALFNFNERNDMIYGESEITYLIPNQIAINRMITANVWSNMNVGMPIMVVNGDTVTCDITNDPGQIVKIYGSNEDVKGAINFVAPPDCSADFNESIATLISNTLSASGATASVLGDDITDTATALIAKRDTSLTSLAPVKNRFFTFIEEISRIWSEFFIKAYGERKIRIEDENGVWYFPFDAKRYKDIVLSAKVEASATDTMTAKEKFTMLLNLFEKQVISKSDFIKRIPDEILSDKIMLLGSKEETV